jgi:zinc/manganese transport system substrate-binding protein
MRVLWIFVCLMVSVSAQAADSKPVKVVASFTILADLARQVGGERVEVLSLVGADGDTHVFQPTPKDARSLKDADLIIINGLGFEGWMKRLLSSSGAAAPVITASKGIARSLVLEEEEEDEEKEEHHHHHGHDEDAPDPHAWQDITNGRQYVRNIATGLMRVDAAYAEAYKARAAALDKELAALDAWVHKQIATVPLEQRAVITTHDAFGYFARAYGVRFLAPVSLSTEDEPSAHELKALAEQVKAGKTRALFFENMSNPNIIKQIAAETGVTVGAPLYADALSVADGAAGTYQAMFRYNVGVLVGAMLK